jgi:hypothetical protein
MAPEELESESLGDFLFLDLRSLEASSSLAFASSMRAISISTEFQMAAALI